MNYERIYKEFILDRKEKEKFITKVDYTETHHIIPKCMGGTNEKENLIKLIPEDHFFAHLLLAKAHGGKNWLALSSMLYRGMKTQKISYKNFISKRREFGSTRRIIAKGLRGLNNHSTDKNIYTLKNFDGREITDYRFEIAKKTGLTSNQIQKLINPNTKTKTLFGWYYPNKNPHGENIKKIAGEKRRSQETFKLFHYDGREWEGTQYEFKEKFGKILFFAKEDSQCQGFFKDKEKAEQYFLRGAGTSKRDRKLYRFQKIKAAEIFYYSKDRACRNFNLTKEEVDDLISKRKQKIKGIKFIDDPIVEGERLKKGRIYKFEIISTKEIVYASISEMSKKYGIATGQLGKLIKGELKKGRTRGIRIANE